MVRKPKKRRGIVLLIVLSLLILFLLIGITFLVVSGTYRGGAEALAEVEQTGDDPEAQIYSAMIQLVVGTSGPTSSLFGQSILADLYGNDWAIATAGGGGVVSGSNGQFVQIGYSGLMPGLPVALKHNHANFPGYYDGCVLTMLDGPAAGFSTRIVGYFPTSATDGLLNVEMFDADSSDLQNLIASSSAYVFANRRFLINGREYNGTGAGYDPGSQQLDKLAAGGPMALLPHFAAYVNPTTLIPVINFGGLDESYDAVDYQNMFLAYVPPEAGNAGDIVPSFHRPSLVTYWNAQGGALTKDYMMRPDPAIHPDFTGSNPLGATFNSITGPWDVDNNGDGITDSIWIDLGFPVKQSDDGRLYKPLFAFMIVDMDGRLNVNAHGNLANIDPGFTNSAATGSAAAGGAANATVRRGRGYGVAEINPRSIFTNDAAQLLDTRYGDDDLPGVPNVDDLGAYNSVGIPPAFFNAALPLSSYGSPPDLLGRRAIFLTYTGHPWFDFLGATGETTDDPYDTNLNAPNGFDTLFTVAELERLLRFRDVDSASLSNRLLMAAPTDFANPLNRRRVTTHSFDIPTPNIFMEGMLSPSAMELYIERLEDNGVADADIPNQVALMMPFELLHGGRMDVNRFWGNGRDDNSNGVVDELGEVNGESIYGETAGYANDYPNALNIHAKQIYARHLYCLMMLLVDSNYDHPTTEALTVTEQRELTARRIAQWAVNCVDYRDPDGIMTPLEFDINPFNGWSVDGDLSTDEGGGVVWGCESADLVLTETLAFHDRRVRDTNFPADIMTEDKDRNDAMNPDMELDQVRIPQGSLFIELYATRNRMVSSTTNPALPQELYFNGNLKIGAVAPNGSPVWRIVIAAKPNNAIDAPEIRGAVGPTGPGRPDTIAFDPRDMNLLSQVSEPLDATTPIERVIWFTSNDPTLSPAGAFFPTATVGQYYQKVTSNLTLTPGRYAVVGPRATTYVGSSKTLDPVTGLRQGSSQQILLTGGTANVETTNLSGIVNSNYSVGNNIHQPMPIICGANPPTGWADPTTTAPSGIGMSISEPLPGGANYYPEPDQSPGVLTEYYYDEVGMAGAVRDIPLDSENTAPLKKDSLLETGTTFDYKSCYLQRLANPLVAWNSLTNPYITVDWATIDLTVFNGEDDDSGFTGMGDFDPDDPNPDDPNFGTRQRGVDVTANSLRTDRFWSPLTSTPDQSPLAAPAVEVYFSYSLKHTLGYLNGTATAPLDSATVGPVYMGDPQSPFPWVAIANRPFANHLELMQVPASSPSRILWEVSVENGADPYRGGSKPSISADAPDFRGPFTHLLNFFHGDDPDPNNPKYGSNFYRILDYLEVPSRFVGTERWYDPETFNAANTSTQAVGTYRAPFNRLSRFRNPGMVNINTIPDGLTGQLMWRAISGLPQAASDTQWTMIQNSRSNYSGALPSPTRIPGVFQSSVSAHLAPITDLERPDIDGTLLRAHPTNTDTPLLADDSSLPYGDTDRNASFRYAGISRLGNMLTNHSNVYAVWITVGYFEVSEVAGPVRFQLGQELGSDTGEISRHRAFFMIDRSIPVAYQPGEAHNVDRCIIHRRFIE